MKSRFSKGNFGCMLWEESKACIALWLLLHFGTRETAIKLISWWREAVGGLFSSLKHAKILQFFFLFL
ncbi:hypothetical protein HRI_004566100 [Hibiscus trionum]|uniref:Uncharacterized protein n=1 Tax=Hibiscus trionum TaxID=183268 RepID=A0A9W7JC18_HIBTR|nr:hypothetical protein HRI_004566100 [Hibiscus trionum]